ncbi:MAG: hypothetical protein JSU70_00940 [Phycisphaerales bacterium]|nr:MAG: hypothetical protein JSU70_00940 [Phycisphaerales bacterium]
MSKNTITLAITLFGPAVIAAGTGPYTEAGISGYINPQSRRHANPIGESNATVNPVFRCWATAVVAYNPAPGVDTQWTNPNKALGPATGDSVFGVVSLGDLPASEIELGASPGQIILQFGDPSDPNDANAIRDVNGYDFAVFENGFVSLYSTHGGSVTGQMHAEFAYVEVSSNGADFARFASVSLTPAPVGPYGTLEISNIYNLAGKHPNANGICTGTPFDLQEIAGDPNVTSGTVDINNIRYVRIVDVPGSGDFYDRATNHVDSSTWPNWAPYPNDHPVYDAWLTWGSGGFDLEAVGVLRDQQHSADINLDGRVDMFDFALLASAWKSRFGEQHWIARSDLAEPKDLFVDAHDMAALATQWLEVEHWRRETQTSESEIGEW